MFLDHILNMLHGLGLSALLLHILQDLFNQPLTGTIPLLHFVVRLMDRFPDLVLFIRHYSAVSLLNLHRVPSLYIIPIEMRIPA